MALDATPASSTAKSYCSVSQATVYLSERLHVEPWYQVLLVTEGYASLAHQREASLIWATSLLDAQVQWYGELTPPFPTDIQRATAYYALALLRETMVAASTGEAGSIKSRKVGDLQITYHDPRPTSTTAARPASQVIPAEVRALLRPYGSVSGGMTVALLRT